MLLTTMLKIYQSNQMNFLVEKLCKKIQSKKKILKKKTILINNTYTKQWLEIQISKKLTICMNTQYIEISKFFINLIKQSNHKLKSIKPNIFEVKYLKWILMSIISKKNDCIFLKENSIQYNNYEFCLHMANVFVKYIFFQPDLIYTWEQEIKNNIWEKKLIWQKKLWSMIIQKTKNSGIANFTDIINNFNKNINKSYFLKFIPKKILIFSNISINPFIITILHIIKNITSIYLFQYTFKKKKKYTNISINFLIKKQKSSSEKKQKKLLYYKKKFFYKKIYTNNILYKLQYDIFKNSLENSIPSKIHYKNHHSLSINQCSSYLQEIQELYKYIIYILNTNKKITLNNILITADNIKPYIFYINNIFNSIKKNNPMIHNISKNNKTKKKIILTIKNLFKIKNNRFKYSWVLSLLNTKYLRKKFYIKSSDIKILYSFISDLYISFGFDKNQFKKMSIPEINTYSWEYAISRITIGYGAQKNYSIWNNISVYNVSCEKSNVLLGNFINLIITLNQLRKKLLNKKTLKNWFHIFTKIINKFFHIPLKHKKFFFILENKWKNIVSEGIMMNYSEKISIDVITDIFFKNNYSLFKYDAFFTGKINITNLKNIRTIPFKMICVLGCIQGSTPPLKKTDILNLANKKTYHDNKNIFFETIMSTQKYFFCSFVKTTDTESTSYASKYIIDIIFYLKKIFYTKKNTFTEKKKNYIHNIYIKHKHKTNHLYFINQKTEYFLHKKKFFSSYKKIKKTTQKNISIKKLINFWKNPVQYYFKKTLKIPKIDSTTEILSEDELFSINSLNQFYINKKILKKKILNKKTNSLYKKLKLQNKIPYGYVGKILWKKQEKKINILAKQINTLRKSPIKKKINIKTKKYKLSGIIKEINAYGLIRWSANKINYKIIISTWIEHIIYCSLYSCTKSILLGINNSSIKFLPLKKNKAKKYLKKYLQGYLDGIKKPILILNSGIIWLQSLYISKYRILNTNADVYTIAKRNFFTKWNGSSFFTGEKKNIYIQKLIPYINTTKIKKICNTCKYWLLPLFKNSNIKKYHLK